MQSDRGDVTDLLLAWQQGDENAFDRLVPLVYSELKSLARRQLARGGRGVTLDTTALVHETYLKLANQDRVALADRRHLFGVVSRAMRQIVVDHARARTAGKRGGGLPPEPLDSREIPVEGEAEALIAVDEALGDLESLDPRLARIVEHRFFAGFSVEETAEALGISVATVDRDWRRARAWLRDALATPGSEP